MMKYVFLFLFILSLLSVPTVAAQTSTPTPTEKEDAAPTEESKTDLLNKQINELKNKIASRVASLDLVDKRGVIGEVVDVKDTQITIKDPQQKTRIIDIDEITKFSSPSSKSSFGISDIEKGDEISVIGLYNKQSRKVLARFVQTTTRPVFISGVIQEIDEDDFVITVIDANQQTTLVDIENITRTNSYSEEDDIVKSGFSRLNVGDRVVVTGTPQKDEGNRITGLRILQLPEAPQHPDITIDTNPKTIVTKTP